MKLLPQPTIEGKVQGIISTDPLTVQCGECGEIAQRTTERTDAVFIILSGFHFHTCEGRDGIRRCPPCLAVVQSECPNAGRHK